MTADAAPISFPRRLADLAAVHPDRPAVVLARRDRSEHVLTYAQLQQRSTRAAHLLAARGARPGRFVAIALPNSLEHYVAAVATWATGACTLPVNARLPEPERDALFAVADPAVVVGDLPGAVTPAELADLAAWPDTPLPDVVATPGKAIPSGGSTGRQKVIVEPQPWARTPGVIEPLVQTVGFRPGQVQLIGGGLFHNTPFTWGHFGLFEGHTVVVMEKFDAEHFVDLVERHRAQFLPVVPTMMARVARLAGVGRRDFSSVERIFHTASACPAWVKRAWIDLVGAQRVVEAYGATDYIGSTAIRGDEWLAHPGSVGRPTDCEIRILDAAGNALPPGEVGDVYMRMTAAGPTFSYVGAPPLRTTPDGFATVGDLGWLDEDGYLFLADRRVDMIVTGGANVYPAEVEAALSEHPGVADVAVIGLPDDEWGRRVHAVVQPADPAHPPAPADLAEHCQARLSPYKRPKSFELVGELPRNQAGKIRRADLVAQRSVPVSAAR